MLGQVKEVLQEQQRTIAVLKSALGGEKASEVLDLNGT